MLIFGISGIIHYFLILQVELFLNISSIFVLLLVPIGVNLVNSAAIAILIEMILRWRNKKIQEMKFQKEIKEFSFRTASIISFAVINGGFLGLYFIFFVIFLDPTIISELPTFGKFVISELISTLVIIGIVMLSDYLQSRKKGKKK
ncbi:MAG: hypothetical protein EAX96_18045 [Candidatus Lokiarchaeota archaeon]|nr:hypothetical protein [Candidatus Lokiarchaeota archaeon]